MSEQNQFPACIHFPFPIVFLSIIAFPCIFSYLLCSYFEIMKKRLSKALASAGVASRRACEEMIFSGKVEVNGEVVVLPQTLVSWEKDEIKVDGKILRGEEKKVYYLLNKPANYICSSKRVGPMYSALI
eukprot:Opistho-1_new@9438